MIIEYRGKRPKIAPSAFVAPTAVLIGDVEVGPESSIWFGAVLRGDNGQSGSARARRFKTMRSSTSARAAAPTSATT